MAKEGGIGQWQLVMGPIATAAVGSIKKASGDQHRDRFRNHYKQPRIGSSMNLCPVNFSNRPVVSSCV